MFIYTAKVRRGRLLLGVLVLIAACGIFTAAAGFHSLWETRAVAHLTETKGIKTNEDRIAYLQSFGWTVNPDALTVEELKLPNTFDESYKEYLSMQAAQGFDLTKYAGKKVKQYTYEITNYPTGETGVKAAILVYKDAVIGGEVFSTEGNGWIRDLTFPK